MARVNDAPQRSGILQARVTGLDNAADRLRNRVNSGELVRVRRGCYIAASAWLRSPPWERHLIATVAAGLSGETEIFCRETALALYGVPLLRTPDAVHLRTGNNGRTGRRRAAPITGAASRPALARAWHGTFGEEPSGEAWLRRFSGVDTRRIQYPLPLRADVRRGLDPLAEAEYHRALQRLAPPLLEHFDPGEVRLRAEPLELCVVDTASQAEPAAAVVILDAVLAGRHTGRRVDHSAFEPWLTCLPSARARARWNSALAFADPLAESPGESLSRVRIAQLGFQKPVLQHSITDSGGRDYRTDFCWPEARIVGEFDGHMKYTRAKALQGAEPAEVVVREKTRERRIEQEGYRVVRWDWDDLRSPETLRRLLDEFGVPRAV
jgi:very-short-patch-repair endonuclease